MTGRGPLDAQPGPSLPLFERLAPAPNASAVARRIDLETGVGDVVADLFGRGGWVARAAVARGRRAVSLESDPLTRMLAEVVLRPPDVRHLDAAVQAIAASPFRGSTLKNAIADLFATRCATCGRTLVADEIVWAAAEVEDAGADRASLANSSPAALAPGPMPITRHYPCTVCRDQLGGSERREAPLDANDIHRATADVGAAAVRARLRSRFPPIPGADRLADDLLDLHTGRQLVGLGAIVERIETDLRAAPVTAALRVALLLAILPASRLATGSGHAAALRVRSGRVRLRGETTFRERNPWLAFEEAFRTVRAFVQRLDADTSAGSEARVGADVRSLADGTAGAVLALAGPTGWRALGGDTRHDDEWTNPSSDGHAGRRPGSGPLIRIILGQPPMPRSLERLAAAYHGTAWALGREAATLLHADALAGASLREPWSWQIDTLETALTAVEPALARDGRVIQLVDRGTEAVLATVLAGAKARYRLLGVEVGQPADEKPAVVEVLRPGGRMPPGARTRANVGLDPVPGGAGDPAVVRSDRVFTATERIDEHAFSAVAATKTATDVAVAALLARGEPADFGRLLGAILVGLDRAGHLARLVRPTPDEARNEDAAEKRGPAASVQAARPTPRTPSDPVETLLAVIRDGLAPPGRRRLFEVEPGRWWLANASDAAAAAAPLADRVEWMVFSLLAAAGPIAEDAFLERVAGQFTGHDLPDESLVRACLDSYRSPTSTRDAVVTADDLLARTHEHTQLVGAIAQAGHRLGMRIWIGRREQARRTADGLLGDLLGPSEQHGYRAGTSRGAEELRDVDVIWYLRGRVAFLWEVEWTAMLGDTLLHRHAAIPPDDSLIRFLVIAPERTELVRYKLARSPLLRAALDAGTWHIVKSDHLQRFLARDPLDLADLEPYLGLDPAVERLGEQMPLFGAV